MLALFKTAWLLSSLFRYWFWLAIWDIAPPISRLLEKSSWIVFRETQLFIMFCKVIGRCILIKSQFLKSFFVCSHRHFNASNQGVVIPPEPLISNNSTHQLSGIQQTLLKFSNSMLSVLSSGTASFEKLLAEFCMLFTT